MSAITAITLADGQSPAANHQFAPAMPQQGDNFAQWRNISDTLMDGKQLSLRVRKLASGYAVEGQVKAPVAALIPEGCCTPSNVPQVAYTDIFDFKFRLPLAGTTASRKDILAFAKNFLSNAAVTDAVTKLEVVW